MTLTARLKALGYPSYRAYLNSRHWQETRRRYWQSHLPVRINGVIVCSACRQRRPLHLHHHTYRRLGNEALTDLALLCNDCHGKAHGRKLGKGSRAAKAAAWNKYVSAIPQNAEIPHFPHRGRLPLDNGISGLGKWKGRRGTV